MASCCIISSEVLMAEDHLVLDESPRTSVEDNELGTTKSHSQSTTYNNEDLFLHH